MVTDYHDEVANQQDGHEDGHHQVVEQGEGSSGNVVESCPLLLQQGQSYSRNRSRPHTPAADHLVGQVDIGTVVKQVLHDSQVSTATRGNEGRVPTVAVLNVELSWIFRQDSEEPMDVSSIGRLAGCL